MNVRDSLFQFKPLSLHDKCALLLGILCNTAFIMALIILHNVAQQKDVVIMYSIGMSLTQMLLGYKALRNLSVYLTWLGLNVLNVVIYCILRQGQVAIATNNQMSLLIGNTVILLLFFQLLRATSLYLTHKEFAALSRGGSVDLWDDKKIFGSDRLLGIIYFGACMLLFVWAIKS